MTEEAARDPRAEARERWLKDDRLRKMSEEDLEAHLKDEAKKLDTELRIEERDGYWHVAFVSLEAPFSIAPDGVEKASSDNVDRHTALINLAEMVELERIQQLPTEQPED